MRRAFTVLLLCGLGGLGAACAPAAKPSAPEARPADSGAPLPPDAELPPSSICDDVVPYDASGTYEVLDPASSAHLVASEHFVVRWNDRDNVPLSTAEVEAGLRVLEDIWDHFIGPVGFEPPYHGEPQKYKVNVFLSDQGWASGAGTGDRDPAMWLHYLAFADTATLAHELAHSLQFATRGMRESPYVGWFWESHAEWMAHEYLPDQTFCAEALVNSPHLYYGSTRNRYCNWQFWEFIQDEHCHRVVNDIWSLAKPPEDPAHTTADPFSTLAANMGWSPSELNDAFGTWALRNITWDYDNGAVYREGFGSYDDGSPHRRSRVTALLPLAGAPDRYAVPEYWAPQRWGYNVVRLVPERLGEAAEVRVRFRGVVQDAPATTDLEPFAFHPPALPAPDSDWRWGLVAVGADGAPRYSALQRGAAAELSFPLHAADSALFMVVVATPQTIHPIMWDQMYYTIYRYPWMVELQGAAPEGHEAGATDPPEAREGAPHPNGGGWVAATASVDPGAFVGPEARVEGSATVRGAARIEDRARVGGSAAVSGAAVIRGSARVMGDARVSGDAVVEDFAGVYAGELTDAAQVGALTVITDPGARVSGGGVVRGVTNSLIGVEVGGEAQMLGDMELWTSLDRGVFYGVVGEVEAADPAFGATRTGPREEVTAAGPFPWPD